MGKNSNGTSFVMTCLALFENTLRNQKQIGLLVFQTVDDHGYGIGSQAKGR